MRLVKPVLVLAALFLLLFNGLAHAQMGTHTDLVYPTDNGGGIHNVYWYCHCSFTSVVTGSTATLSGQLFVKYFKADGTMFGSKRVNTAAYTAGNLPVSIPAGSSYWILTSATTQNNVATDIPYYYQLKYGTAPPIGLYTCVYYVNTFDTINDPNWGPLTDTGTSSASFTYLVVK